jgi:cytoskeletal protein RodZ
MAAKQNKKQPTPQKKKRIIRPIEWLMLLIVLLLISYLLLQGLRNSDTNRTEEVTWLDRSNGLSEPTVKRSVSDQQVETALKDIAQQFADDKNRRVQVSDLQKRGVSEDEAKFFHHLRQTQGTEQTTEEQWLNIIAKSRATYQQLRTIFAQAKGNRTETVDEETIASILNNSKIKQQVFKNIEQNFGVPVIALEAFAARGSRKLGDWAVFVDQNKTN